MKYIKPDFIVEEFMLNNAVAACTTDVSGSTTTYDPQYIWCLDSNVTHEEVFNSASSCDHTPWYVKQFTAGTYTEYDFYYQLSGGEYTNGSKNKKITIESGYYVAWSNKTNNKVDHWGLANAYIVNTFINSY